MIGPEAGGLLGALRLTVPERMEEQLQVLEIVTGMTADDFYSRSMELLAKICRSQREGFVFTIKNQGGYHNLVQDLNYRRQNKPEPDTLIENFSYLSDVVAVEAVVPDTAWRDLQYEGSKAGRDNNAMMSLAVDLGWQCAETELCGGEIQLFERTDTSHYYPYRFLPVEPA